MWVPCRGPLKCEEARRERSKGRPGMEVGVGMAGDLGASPGWTWEGMHVLISGKHSI